MKEWTVMVYLAGDNNLSEECVWSLKEMYRAGINHEKIGLVVQIDPRASRMRLFDISDDLEKLETRQKRTGLYRAGVDKGLSESYERGFENDATDGFLVSRGKQVRGIVTSHSGSNSASPAYVKRGRHTRRSEMLSPEQLTAFIKEARKRQPAHRYLLILSGHGGGGIGETFLVDGFPPSALSMPELRSSLSKARIKIHVLGMDACGMGMAEVGYELRKHVDYMVAAEGFELNIGWPYHLVLKALTDEPTIEPRLLAANIVTAYNEYYSDFVIAGTSTDLAACDLNKSDGLAKDVRALARVLRRSLADDKVRFIEDLAPTRRAVTDAVVLAHWRAQSYRFEQNLDLWDFCDLLEKGCRDRQVAKACLKVKETIEGSRSKKDGTNSGYVIKACRSGGAFQHSHGVSVYFPWAEFLTEYHKLGFSRETKWGEFLDDYVKKTRRGPRLRSGRELFIPQAEDSTVVVRDSPLLSTRDSPLLSTRDQRSLLPRVKNPPNVFVQEES